MKLFGSTRLLVEFDRRLLRITYSDTLRTRDKSSRRDPRGEDAGRCSFRDGDNLRDFSCRSGRCSTLAREALLVLVVRDTVVLVIVIAGAVTVTG